MTRYEGLVWWRLHGEHGISSEAIADRLEYGATASRWRRSNYPHDPSDFRRCERLLRAAPAMRDDLPQMAVEGPEWAALVQHWDDVVALIEADAPGSLDALSWPQMAFRAYALIQRLTSGRTVIPTVGDVVRIGRRGRVRWEVIEAHVGPFDVIDELVIRSPRGATRRVAGNGLADLWQVTT